MAFTNGPYLQAAVLCEKVIEDKQGVLTLVRIVDRIIVSSASPSASDVMPVTQVGLTLVIMLKAGQARGGHMLAIRPEAPSGLKGTELRLSILFEGEDRGNNVVLDAHYQAKEEGLHWFDVLLDSELITRIPLRVVYQRITAGRPPTLGQDQTQ